MLPTLWNKIISINNNLYLSNQQSISWIVAGPWIVVLHRIQLMYIACNSVSDVILYQKQISAATSILKGSGDVMPNEINCVRNARPFGWRHKWRFAKFQILFRLGKFNWRCNLYSRYRSIQKINNKKAVRALKMAALDDMDVIESWEEIEDSGVCYL